MRALSADEAATSTSTACLTHKPALFVIELIPSPRTKAQSFDYSAVRSLSIACTTAVMPATKPQLTNIRGN